MKIILLICLLLFSFAIFAQDEDVTEEVTTPEVEVVEETPATAEEVVEETQVDSELVESTPVVTEEVEENPVVSEEAEEAVETVQPNEPVEEVMETTNSADIKAKFRNIKTLKSTQEEEVKIDIRKPDDSSIMPRKQTDFEYLQKRDMEEKLKKSNKMLY
jgi:hypothetical protein